MVFSSLLFSFRMQEKDLQSMCRRALLLTVCMVSLWGQLTSASSHRSHIGTTQCVFLVVIGPGQRAQNKQNLLVWADQQLHCGG